MGFSSFGVHIYITDDDFVDGPRQYPLHLFEITDGKVPSSWSLARDVKDGEQQQMLAPAKWLAEPWFFERLVDGEPEAVRLFKEIKSAIDEET